VAELRQKRDLALGLLRQIPAVTCPTPQGAFYLLPDVSAYFGKATPEGVRIASAAALCVALLDKYKVSSLVLGSCYVHARAWPSSTSIREVQGKYKVR
jgi:aspartate/methionine/tyrosine aminotransferase